MKIRYSIIVPYYNGSDYILETINSIIEQDLQDFELIIIDDSSDLKHSEFLSLNIDGLDIKNLILKRNSSNLGLMATLNKAVEISKGDFLIILGQDDLIEKNHLSSFDTEIRRHGEDFSIIFCDAKYISQSEKTERKVRGRKLNKFQDDSIDFNSLMNWNFVCSTGACIKKSLLEDVGGFVEKYRNYGEWLTWLLLCNKKNIIINRGVYSWYRRHDKNITNSMFSSEFKKTYEYYKYVNYFAYSMSPKSLKIMYIYLRNVIKNILLLAYKLLFKTSIAHLKVKK